LIFEKYLVPDRICNCYRDVTPKLLASLGVRYLLCDIDNTLVTYDDPMPTEQLSQWLFILYKSGITVGFVSNNDKERVDGFNKELEYVAYATTPMERSIRVERLADYMKNLPQAQHDFVEYLINAYIVNGIDELAMQKLATLLELKFGSLIEGVSALGGASAAQQTFRDFQRELYA